MIDMGFCNIHVSDLAKAHVLALEAIKTHKTRTAYNLANGKGLSVKELIDTSSIVTKKELLTIAMPRRAGDPSRLVGNSSRTSWELGCGSLSINCCQRLLEQHGNGH